MIPGYAVAVIFFFFEHTSLKSYKQKPEKLGSWRKEGIPFVSIRNAILGAIGTFTPGNLSQFVEAGAFTDQLLVHFETDQ